MGAGNIMHGFQAPFRGSLNIPCGFGSGRGGIGFHDTRLCHADLSANTKYMVQHPDMQQAVAWKAANPNKYKRGDESALYPLTPGTDTVGTDECFTCGLHHCIGMAYLCPEVDPYETFYFQVANHIIKNSHTPPAAPAAPVRPVPSNVHWVNTTDACPGHYIPYEKQPGKWGWTWGLVEHHWVFEGNIDERSVFPKALEGFLGDKIKNGLM
jgi:hypothetical protein